MVLGKAFFWLTIATLFFAILYGVREILMPFLIGMAVAYLLDPAADCLQRWGFSRGLAAAFSLAPFFLAVSLILGAIIPLLKDQVNAFLLGFPTYAEGALRTVSTWFFDFKARLDDEPSSLFRSEINQYADDLLAWVGNAVGNLWRSGLALFNALSLLIITPVVAFYLLRDWDLLVARLDRLLPREKAAIIRHQLSLIDRTLSGFLRGAGLVCLSLAAFYGVALSLIGLQFGLLIGIVCGLISFVPYIGALAGLLVGLAVAIVQFQAWGAVVLVGGVFLVGQLAESYILTPRLVGDRVGLHPLWLLFALMAGGALMGFVGLLLAVPVAAILGVLTRWGIEWYLESPYYKGGA